MKPWDLEKAYDLDLKVLSDGGALVVLTVSPELWRRAIFNSPERTEELTAIQALSSVIGQAAFDRGLKLRPIGPIPEEGGTE